jgi:hypothetical protein
VSGITQMPDSVDALGDWDHFCVDDTTIPVNCRVDINMPVEIDIQKANGKKKARLKDSGDLPAKVTITFTIADMIEAAAMKAAMPLFRPKSIKGERQARTCKHPQLWFWDLDKLVFTGIKSEHPDLVNGWKVEIEAIEWVPEPKAVGKAKVDASKTKAEQRDTDAWNEYVNGEDRATKNLRQTDPAAYQREMQRLRNLAASGGALPPSSAADTKLF